VSSAKPAEEVDHAEEHCTTFDCHKEKAFEAKSPLANKAAFRGSDSTVYID
jgi:hypothetical protein